jgi:protein TonB
MNQLVDNDFQPVGLAAAGRRPRDFFGWMLAISLTLHVISSVFLLSPRQGTFTMPTVSYLDLKNIALDEQVMASPDDPAPVEAPAEEPREVPEPPAAAYPETERFDQDVRRSLTEAQADPDALGERSFSLGLSSGYFSSIGSGESLRDGIREYYFQMLREINEKWWLNSGSRSGGRRGAVVEVVVARNGTIVDKTLVRSSGNRAFDRAIMATLEQANPLPPLPGDYQTDFFRAPLRFVAPLHLFGS